MSTGKSALDIRTMEEASVSLDQRKGVAVLTRRRRVYSAWSLLSPLRATQRLTWGQQGPAQSSSRPDRECGASEVKEKELFGGAPNSATARMGRKGKTC
jgi:hypothetical protein